MANSDREFQAAADRARAKAVESGDSSKVRVMDAARALVEQEQTRRSSR